LVSPHHAQECAAWDLGNVPVWSEIITGTCPEKLRRGGSISTPRSWGITADVPRDGASGLRQAAVREGRRAYVLVNNRSEGNTPRTVQALVDTLTGW